MPMSLLADAELAVAEFGAAVARAGRAGAVPPILMMFGGERPTIILPIAIDGTGFQPAIIPVALRQWRHATTPQPVMSFAFVADGISARLALDDPRARTAADLTRA